MTAPTQVAFNPVEITLMSPNLILRLDQDGSVWAKACQPKPFTTETLPATVYINGVKYSVSTIADFVKLLPI